MPFDWDNFKLFYDAFMLMRKWNADNSGRLVGASIKLNESAAGETDVWVRVTVFSAPHWYQRQLQVEIPATIYEATNNGNVVFQQIYNALDERIKQENRPRNLPPPKQETSNDPAS